MDRCQTEGTMVAIATVRKRLHIAAAFDAAEASILLLSSQAPTPSPCFQGERAGFRLLSSQRIPGLSRLGAQFTAGLSGPRLLPVPASSRHRSPESGPRPASLAGHCQAVLVTCHR
jgi:hypothetical protein